MSRERLGLQRKQLQPGEAGAGRLASSNLPQTWYKVSHARHLSPPHTTLCVDRPSHSSLIGQMRELRLRTATPLTRRPRLQLVGLQPVHSSLLSLPGGIHPSHTAQETCIVVNVNT
jgi:hypothetical protein